jgi:hypothetical protein
MTKVSTNAGKHPYLRNDGDFAHLFDHIHLKKEGIKFDFKIKPKFNPVDTDLKDKNGVNLFHMDIVQYKREEYLVGYDTRNFNWKITKISDNKTSLNLNDVHKSVVICNKK